MIFRRNCRPLDKVSRLWFCNGWIRSIFSIFRHGSPPPTYLLPVSQHSSFFCETHLQDLMAFPFGGWNPQISLKWLFFSHWSYSFPPLPVQLAFTFFCIHWNQSWETSFCLHLCGNSVTTMLSHIKPAKIFPRKNNYLRSKCCPNSRPPPLSPAPTLLLYAGRESREPEALKGKRWVCCQCFPILESVGRLWQAMVKGGIGVS